MLLKTNRVLGYPVKILFEPTNACNLSCPLCPTGNGSLNRATGQMRLDEFKKIIDEVLVHGKECAQNSTAINYDITGYG